jgi:hypothetical protein
MRADKAGGVAPALLSLFRDLYAYRQRENRDPLEDWLTECMAIALRALPEEAQAAFFSWCSGVEIDEAQKLLAVSGVSVETQFFAGTAGRPDLVILLDGQPWIVFENKVSHGIGRRANEDGADSHQLRAYADWLDANASGKARSALVFVSHITPPPDDFRGRQADALYHGMHRVHTSWGAVARRLSSSVNHLENSHYAKVIAAAFLGYLEQQNMSNEFPTSVAFAAAELYLNQATPLENLVERMWDEVKLAVKFGRTADYQIKALADEGTVGAWRYVMPGLKGPQRWNYLQTGFWYPGAGSWIDTDALGSEAYGAQAVVFFGNSDDEMYAGVSDAPLGFLRPATNFLACKPVAAFPTDPQARGESIISWAAEQTALLKPFLIDHGLVGQ